MGVGDAPLLIDASPHLCLATESKAVVTDELGADHGHVIAEREDLYVAQRSIIADVRRMAAPFGYRSRAVLNLADPEANNAGIIPEPCVECDVILRDECGFVLEEAPPHFVGHRTVFLDQVTDRTGR